MADTLIVAGDVGGTNARLQLWRCTAADGAVLVAADTSSSQSHASPLDLLEAFFALSGVAAADIGCCCLALCGPVDVRENACAVLDALPHWGRVAGERVDEHFGWPAGTCLLANDFVAVAEGVLALEHSAEADGGGLRKLGGGAGVRGGAKVCIGAGTGLGVSYLLADAESGEYRAYPSEMGMAAFGPRTADERRVVDSLQSERAHAIIEDIVSGQGVWRAHKALSGEDAETAALVARLGDSAGADADARRAVDLVVAGLGRAMADCLHIFLATGGIYIAGGVLAKVLDVYPEAADVLLDAFRTAVSLPHLVAPTPIVLVTVESGLLGARRLAMQRLARSGPPRAPLATPPPSGLPSPVAAGTAAAAPPADPGAFAVPRRLGAPHELEYSLHATPRSFRRELVLVFAERGDDVAKDDSLHVLLLMQHAAHDLLGMTAAVAAEKDRLLEAHMRLADPLCRILRGRGFWADYTDPASGQPVLSPAGPSIYPDLSGFVRMLKYPTFDAGGCRVTSHPEWGTHCYPSTIFFSAPPALVDSIVRMITGA